MNSPTTRLILEYQKLCKDVYETYIQNLDEYFNERIDDDDKIYINVLLSNSTSDIINSIIPLQDQISCIKYYTKNKNVLYNAILNKFVCIRYYGLYYVDKLFPSLYDIYKNMIIHIKKENVDTTDDFIRQIIMECYQHKFEELFEPLRNDLRKCSLSKRENKNPIGKGAYGNVYKPPLFSENNRQVGKIFKSRNDWIDEYQIGTKLRNINNGQNFLVLPNTIDDINAKVLQLRYGYAGIPYTKYLKNLSEDKDINNGIIRIRQCSKLISNFINKYMNTFGKSELVHLDIKPDNVLYDSNKDTLRLIDFSWVRVGKKLFDVRYNRQLLSKKDKIEHIYGFWPPELNLYHLGVDNSNDVYDLFETHGYGKYTTVRFEHDIQNFKDDFIRFMGNKIILNKKILEIFNIKLHTILDEYISQGTKFILNTSNIRGFDAWGIGITFIWYIQYILTAYKFTYIPDSIVELINLILDKLMCVNVERDIQDFNEKLKTIII